jgi:hypothetical protein
MKFLTTIIGILPVLCVVAPCYAALQQAQTQRTNGRDDSRISVSPSIGVTSAANIAAARRMPTLKVTGSTTSSTTTTTTTSSTSSLMDEVECVERYTECIKASDVCDFNFEECTTKELFYAKKPQCNSVLLQCSSAGINTLFGTSDLTQLSVTNADLYPSAGSIVGQFIDAGAIGNRLDTSSCVKRYTSCLKKDNVCGEDFELCTTNSEFKKQKIYCESTLARCQEDGIKELFGLTDTSRDPTSQSRLGVMITEGAGLAAVNAVSTCYKVADQCVLSACSANPYRCMEGSSTLLSDTVDAINEGRTLTNEQMQLVAEALTKQQVSKYIKNACFDTIGGNKYCHMTVNEGKMPSSKALIDEDERDNVYADIIGPTMKRVDTQLQKILDKFDKKAKDTCSDTITACAMRSCGSGIGSLCYSRVFGSGNSASDFENSINGDATYSEIKAGCESIVNSDANCQYAAASATAKNYSYSYNEATTFTNLFPAEAGKDPIGVITRLNASLAQNYNNAAIEQMAKDCKNTAVSCIRSMCGADFVNCYRNRTDVMSDAYNTDNADFNKSMNKVTGVLDFNIVRGLCVNMVKGSDKCDEHLKIQTYRMYADGNGKTGWGNKKTVRDAWVDASKDGYNQTDSADTRILMGCMVKKSNTASGGLMGLGGESICDSKAGNPNYIEDCGTVDEEGCLYDEEYYVTETDYQYSMTVDTMFQEILADLELEAQAKYNAKLTAEQHMCIDANSGGIMGNREGASTYMWVKLRSKRIPKNYSTAGLKVNDFTESNDLYGSFCRARVTIQSDDPDIQTILQSKNNNWSTAYFAVGDVFTCGSWIPQKSLEQMSKRVACKKAVAKGTLPSNTKCETDADIEKVGLTTGQKWAVAAAAIGGSGLGGVGGAYLTDAVQSSNLLGGLLQRNRNSDEQNSRNVSAAQNCKSRYSEYQNYVGKDGEENNSKAYQAAMAMRQSASSIVNRRVTTKQEDGSRVARDLAVRNFEEALEDIKNKCKAEDAAKNQQCKNAVAVLYASCDNVMDYGGQLANYDNNSRRQALNLTGAALGATGLGLTAGFVTRDLVRESNRQQFTADQQEFMDNVGEHIYCFIGADEAGTYGDLIEISVE